MSLDLSLYLVTDSRLAARAGHDVVSVVRAAVSNGVSTVQVREKDASGRAFLETVLSIGAILPPDIALIVNDRVDVFLAARAAGAPVAGVHLGQSDLPVSAVRALVGPDAVIGLSASTPEQLRSAAADPAAVDYVGIGALHATSTKSDAPPELGHSEFARLVALSELPAIAIGGVIAADLSALRKAGAAGAAIVSAICSSADPGAAARELREAWEAAV